MVVVSWKKWIVDPHYCTKSIFNTSVTVGQSLLLMAGQIRNVNIQRRLKARKRFQKFSLPGSGLAHGCSNSLHFMEKSLLIFSKTHLPKIAACKYESLLCPVLSLIKHWTGGTFKGAITLEPPTLMFSTRCPGSLGVAKREAETSQLACE